MDEEISAFIARLLARGCLPRNDPAVIRVLTEPTYREALDRRLSACGVKLLDNPFAAFVGLGIQPAVARSVFHEEDRWLSNTLGLTKPEVALLVVLWALLILPKRARQQSRADGSQSGLFDSLRPLSRESTERVSEKMLYEEFGHLGARTYLAQRLSILTRHRFITRASGEIMEGPLLDLAFDYNVMASRIIEGTLSDIKAALRKSTSAGDARSPDGSHKSAAPLEGEADV